VDDPIERAVERAITTMRENLGEPLTVDDMARAAMFSKFHFTRFFQRVTGVSPGRFLSALRLQQAKRLLVTTSLNVADISLRVGYNSVGTFSSRFSRSVGLSPTTFRKLGGFANEFPPDNSRSQAYPSSAASVRGNVLPHWPEHRGAIFIGLFPDRIPEGRPVRCAVLPGPGAFQLENVPEGDWYLLAHCATGGPQDILRDPGDQPSDVLVGTLGPLTVRTGTTSSADVQLKPLRVLDPPVLLALVDARMIAAAVEAELAAEAELAGEAELAAEAELDGRSGGVPGGSGWSQPHELPAWSTWPGSGRHGGADRPGTGQPDLGQLGSDPPGSDPYADVVGSGD
jgi:AraC family transcriptional regulator